MPSSGSGIVVACVVRTWSGSSLHTCHGDLLASNWVLTRRGPVLVDLLHLSRGPAGFDAAFFAAFVDRSVSSRLAWLDSLGVPALVASTVVGCAAAMMADGLTSDDQLWRDWAAPQWPPVRDLAWALHQRG